MELSFFVVFVIVQIFLAVLSLWRKGVLYSLIGLAFSVFLLPFSLNNIVVSRTYTVNPINGTTTEHLVLADNTLTVLIFAMLIILHFIAILRSVR